MVNVRVESSQARIRCRRNSRSRGVCGTLISVTIGRRTATAEMTVPALDDQK
jgi:hypothetical protein